MPILRLEHGQFIVPQDGGEVRRPADAADIEALVGWAKRYDTALALPAARHLQAADALLTIGQAMRRWLDDKDLSTALIPQDGAIDLVLAVPAEPDAAGRALLDAPWELLTDRQGRHLAADDKHAFRPARRLGPADGKPLQPLHADLALMFMAAAPVGASELDYEQEEALILGAVDRQDAQVAVEESGALEFLADRLGRELPIEALHLSCHSGIDKDKKQAFLALENEFGGLAPASAGDLRAALGEKLPPLIFLSACRTAEQTASAVPLAIDLVGVGVPNVVGWDGSVYDTDAAAFAAPFYKALARRASVGEATATTRRALLRRLRERPQEGIGRHWHLARLYLGRHGGGALCGGTKKRDLRRGVGAKEFLDAGKQVPVAAAEVFVGRRREAQRILRCFRDADTAGVLLHGIGRLGKSSLAARVASRLMQHRVAVVFQYYDALAIFDKLVEALAPGLRRDVRNTWRPRLAAAPRDEALLRDAFETILTGPARHHDAESKLWPILVVVDDLERILEDPRAGEMRTRVRDDFRLPLRALIQAFAATRDTSQSRLLLTSRYAFTLPEQQGDAALRLHDLPLPPLTERQRGKLVQAEMRVAGAAPDAARAGLLDRAVAVAEGHPGLQSLLTRAILTDPAVAEGAIAAAERFRTKGTIPQGGALGQFFVELTLQHHRDALTAPEVAQMRAALVFTRPVPRTALEATGTALGVSDPAAAIARLIGLGCLDAIRQEDADEEAFDLAANGLAGPLFSAPDAAETQRVARAAVPILATAWRGASGRIWGGAFAEELVRLARLAGDAPQAFIDAAGSAAASRLYHHHDARAGLDLVREALGVADRHGIVPSAYLLRIGAECAERLGDAAIQDDCLARGLALQGSNETDMAQLWGRYGERLVRKGEIVAAETWFNKAADVFERLGEASSRAVTLGQIADVLQQRGDIEEALRIRTVDCLPVYERLGDARSRAVTMGKIADVLQQRGDYDEALRIRREEQLPVYERLGDARSRAMTMGKIADVLQQRGDYDEALRIRREEQLPVYERLGDARERAVTMGKIADVLQQRGDYDEALRIRREEQLPVYERLGDARSRAVTLGKIADVLQQRGDTEEALRIRREEELPVYERLGDARSRAVTMGQIADVLQQRGDTEEALRIRREDCLPVYERLGDARERSVTLGKIADVFEMRGDTEEALRIRREECLPIHERMGDQEAIIYIRFRIATAQWNAGLRDEPAIKIVLQDLGTAFRMARELGRADYIAVIGEEFGTLLGANGARDSAIAVLTQAAAAAAKIGQNAMVERIEARIAAL